MEIQLEHMPYDIHFHPSESLVTTCLISGELQLYRYASNSEPQRLWKIDAHEEACRAARFINEGSAIVTGSPDCSILCTNVETGAEVVRLKDAHAAPVNRIINLTESTIASGDDEGCVKVWDTRQRTCCNTFDVHEEYISDMTFATEYGKLLTTSGDGTLSVCNLRRNKVQARSEFAEDELLSVALMKNGQKVICGTQTGNILLYSWGFFQDCSDRFVDLSPNPIEVLLKLDEDRVITGSDNGIISLVSILPNKIVQPMAEHSEYPIEGLAFSHDRKILGSISHDNMLKMWDVDELLQGPPANVGNRLVDSDGDSEDMEVDNGKTKPQGNQPLNNFFADL
ncbi:uncharacterized protein [Phyllobates terribilis]|uniref:uncharacterized protein n=1 Tax=Phyllobates terribilis TaxID=111132 RepID=UPI003CCB5454